MIDKLAMSAAETAAFVRRVYPEADEFGWEIVSLEPGRIGVEMAIGQNHLRPGGTVSGPTMFALADIAAYLLVLAHVGEVELAVTSSLTIHFLNKPPAAGLVADGRLVKLGRSLAVCEIHIRSQEGDRLVATATATYAIPRPRSS